MKFTDVFIKRPVMGVALSIIIVILGLFSISKMNTREYPKLVTASINVSVSQVGTSAESIKNYITSPLESALAQVEDVDYMTSNSSQGRTSISLYFIAGTDIDNAFNNVIAAVNAVKKNLPSSADDPIVTKDSGRAINPLYISFRSDVLNPSQLVDYLSRNVQPNFYTVNGVSSISFMTPGLNLVITLDPEKIAKYNLSPSIVAQSISQNNIQIPAGQLKSQYRTLTNNVDGTVKSVEELRNLVVYSKNEESIRLKDIASVSLESIKGTVNSTFNGIQTTVMGFGLTPSANPLTVVPELIKKYNDEIVPSLPSYIETSVIYDGTVAVNSAINSVIKTVFEAVVIVMFVMLLFLGSMKSLIVPIIAIPISIIGNFLILYAMGYSINMITLLAMILAIGLVVDDAIVVLENIHRHIRLGETPFRAAIIGTREIAAPVIVMTLTLAVVFLPIALSSGATGPIYKEFAITLAGSVILSGVVSLTLSPMLTYKLYQNYDHTKIGKFEHLVENTLENAASGYTSGLKWFVRQSKTALLLIIVVAFTIISVPRNINSELTPTEDRGILVVFAAPPANSTLAYAEEVQAVIDKKLADMPDVAGKLAMVMPSRMINMMPLTSERSNTQADLVNIANRKLGGTPGVSPRAINFPEIQVPGSGFFNFSVAIQTSKEFEDAIPYATKFLQAAIDDGMILQGNLGVRYNQSKLNIAINRDKASELSVPISSIASSLSSYLSGAVAARVSIDGTVYSVVTQLPDSEKDSTSDLNNFYVTSSKGQNIPLSELVTYEITSQPASLPRLNQLNSVAVEGFSLKASGDLVNWIKENFNNYFPKGYSYSLTGELRTYVQEGNQNTIIFVLAFIMIFLVLAMQFNSWRDGIVIMITVPLAVSGSMVVLYIFNLMGVPGATMNLYTTIGLMTLTGLITKHGILMCEVAREEQINHRLSRRRAILVAARLRFRPILMTTLAMVAGLVPLLMATGTGANARFAIALVIVSGLSIGTMFTLFILPLVYSYIGKIHRPLPYFDEDQAPIAELPEAE